MEEFLAKNGRKDLNASAALTGGSA